jgi:hypothetical protein
MKLSAIGPLSANFSVFPVQSEKLPVLGISDIHCTVFLAI